MKVSIIDLDGKLTGSNATSDLDAAMRNEHISAASRQQDAMSVNRNRLVQPPPPAAGIMNTASPAAEGADKMADTSSASIPTKNRIATASSLTETQNTVTDTWPWVIYLASLRDKADAEHFADGARSRGIAADLYQTTVKERNTWRVYAPGFASANEARDRAACSKEILAIKAVWIAS